MNQSAYSNRLSSVNNNGLSGCLNGKDCIARQLELGTKSPLLAARPPQLLATLG